MESENGVVALEDEKCVVVEENRVEESHVDSNKKGKNADLGEKVPTTNGKSEPVKVNDGIDSSVVATKASVTALPGKTSKIMKVKLVIVISLSPTPRLPLFLSIL